MKITIISVFPELHQPFITTSIVGKAIEKSLVKFNLIKLSDLCPPKVRIDEPTCGPGVGMIIKPEIIDQAIDKAENKWGPGFKIFLSPQGVPLTQTVLQQLEKKLITPLVQEETETKEYEKPQTPHIILVCSRYEGIDERVKNHYADLTLSIGDFVMMGGDLPAQVFLESFLRLLPGVIGNQTSVQEESFSDPLLDHPQYGLPVMWHNQKVPEVVLSGNHGEIQKWRTQQATKNTVYKRFDWFRSQSPNPEQVKAAKGCIPPHYVAVMHTQINIKGGRVGHSSIASLDIHDIARSARTYGIKNYFIASPIKDQQKILETFLHFWQSEAGKKYNESRFEAVSIIKPVQGLQEILERIEEQEGKKPLIIATSAKQHLNAPTIDYFSQSKVWQNNRPVLLVFGTGQGLADVVLEQCDYILAPVQGMTDYNHLSVRAAVSIILDRWIGLNPRLTSPIDDTEY